MAERNDFFDNIDSSLCDSEILEVDDDEKLDVSDVSEYPYVISFNKKESNFFNDYNCDETSIFNKSSLQYIYSLFANSECILKCAIVVGDHTYAVDFNEDFDNPLGIVTVYFNLTDDFKARSFRKLILTIMKLERDPCSFYQEFIISCRKHNDDNLINQMEFNMVNPEETVFSAFFVCDILNKYVQELGFQRLIEELHLKMMAYYNLIPRVGYQLCNETYLTNLFKDNPQKEIVSCVPLIGSVETAKDTFRMYCPYSFELTPKLNFDNELWFKYRHDQTALDSALKSESITYDFAKTDDETFCLNWYKKIIYLEDSLSNKVPFIVVSVTRKEAEKPVEFNNNAFFIEIASRSIIMHSDSNNFYELIKRFIIHLFDVYRDCFESTRIWATYEPSVGYKKVDVFGYYKLKKDLNIKLFYKFLKDLCNYKKRRNTIKDFMIMIKHKDKNAIINKINVKDFSRKNVCELMAFYAMENENLKEYLKEKKDAGK